MIVIIIIIVVGIIWKIRNSELRTCLIYQNRSKLCSSVLELALIC